MERMERECPANGGTAAGSNREMPSHLRRWMLHRAEEPRYRTVPAEQIGGYARGLSLVAVTVRGGLLGRCREFRPCLGARVCEKCAEGPSGVDGGWIGWGRPVVCLSIPGVGEVSG